MNLAQLRFQNFIHKVAFFLVQSVSIHLLIEFGDPIGYPRLFLAV